MASSGANGALATSVTGTIYAPNDHALFTDKVSGTWAPGRDDRLRLHRRASTGAFNFDASGLYGNGLTFLRQSG